MFRQNGNSRLPLGVSVKVKGLCVCVCGLVISFLILYGLEIDTVGYITGKIMDGSLSSNIRQLSSQSDSLNIFFHFS